MAAGYAEAGAAVLAHKLLRDQRIIDRINQLHAENMARNRVTVDSVLSNLEHDRALARENHQYAVAKACTELQGRYLAMFTDRQQVEDVTETRRLTEREAEEARRIAEIRLREICDGTPFSGADPLPRNGPGALSNGVYPEITTVLPDTRHVVSL
jgi:phage terminase small subunit